MLDNIEANLEDANDYMEKAEENLKRAKKWHEKTRTVTILNLLLTHLLIENVLHYDMYVGSDVCVAVRSVQNPIMKRAV